MGRLKAWKRRARQLQGDNYALYLACRHPRVPWYAKLFAACVVAYAFSPIDLIPDFVPVLGYLDDLILVPAGLWLVLRLIPPPALAAHRAAAEAAADRPVSCVAMFVVIAVCVAFAAAAVALILK